ncbi:cell division protein FtsA [Buchnera aphidicola (Kurisakia onigurumii)]|uniref:cell division protein FtsA n=1 Tax=Buchnera aphidicola TaxID=9 RepID=UPI0031B67C86
MVQTIEKELIVSLEVGNTKIVVLIGEILKKEIKIIGIGACKSKGIDKNGINDLTNLIKCIKFCLQQAENSSNCFIDSVLLSISNKYIFSQNEIGIIPILGKEITYQDVNNVINIAKYVKIKNNHTILHIIPQEYIIDNNRGIKNPIGLTGIRMQAKVHLITCNKIILKNLIQAVEKTGVKVNQAIFSGLASSQSVLTKEEKENGVCMIDIGSDTMDITLYHSGFLEYSKVIPYSGNSITNDISYAFSISKKHAEIIKLNYDVIIQQDKNSEIDIPEINKKIYKKINKKILIDVIESRYTELLSLVKNEIKKIQNQSDKTINIEKKKEYNIVLTGGAANINSIIHYAKKIFKNQSIRIGYPNFIKESIINLSNPEYSTSIGLLKYGKNKILNIKNNKKKLNNIKNFFQKINYWIKKSF